MKSARLQTNLVGRKVHLLTDEEAKGEAKKQQHTLTMQILETITAETWFPAIKNLKRRCGTGSGEIVAVYIGNDGRLVYTIAFGGELVELMPDLFRLDPV